ncbi:MAG: hypothetical protein ChlgKO_03620 [Chlamydiales bacterium]
MYFYRADYKDSIIGTTDNPNLYNYKPKGYEVVKKSYWKKKRERKIKTALKISPGSLATTWRFVPTAKSKDDGAQVDLLFDSLDDTITICEIKYACDEYAIDKTYAHKLLKKMEIFRKRTRTKKQLFLVMVTTFGLKQTMYSEEIVTNQVTLDDLFK